MSRCSNVIVLPLYVFVLARCLVKYGYMECMNLFSMGRINGIEVKLNGFSVLVSDSCRQVGYYGRFHWIIPLFILHFQLSSQALLSKGPSIKYVH